MQAWRWPHSPSQSRRAAGAGQADTAAVVCGLGFQGPKATFPRIAPERNKRTNSMPGSTHSGDGAACLCLRRTREVASGNPLLHVTRTLSKCTQNHKPVLECSYPYHIIFAISYLVWQNATRDSHLTLLPSVPINEKCSSTVTPCLKLFIRPAAWQ